MTNKLTFNRIHFTGSSTRQSATIADVLGNWKTLRKSGCSVYGSSRFVMFTSVKFSMGKPKPVATFNQETQPRKRDLFNYKEPSLYVSEHDST